MSASVRLGLESLCEGNESSIRSMLSLGSDKPCIDGLVECMGVNSISAEMLMANYFNPGMLATYCKERINKSDKGGAATLAERIAREWAKPSFQPMPAPAGKKRQEPDTAEETAEDAEEKRAAAMADLMAKQAAKRAKTEAAAAAAAAATAAAAAAAAAASAAPKEDDAAAEAEEAFPLAKLVLPLETCESVDDAVSGLAGSEELTCEDVLSALCRWGDTAKAAAFLKAWERTAPKNGCDMELCFEAIPRIEIKGEAVMAKAGTIIGDAFRHEEEREANALSGFWDVDIIPEADRDAFMEAWRKAKAAA